MLIGQKIDSSFTCKELGSANKDNEFAIHKSAGGGSIIIPATVPGIRVRTVTGSGGSTAISVTVTSRCYCRMVPFPEPVQQTSPDEPLAAPYKCPSVTGELRAGALYSGHAPPPPIMF